MVMPDLPPRARLPLLVLGMLSLLAGIGGGLMRLGWDLPLPRVELLTLHGPLMISGFFGTVIGLERAVALARLWAYAGPALTGGGALALLLGAPAALGAGLILLGSLVLAGGSLGVFLRQRAIFTAALLAGAGSWVIGNLLWLLGSPVPAVVPWWAAFLVLTIAAERLELTRFRPRSRPAEIVFVTLVLLLLGALAADLAFAGSGRLLAASLLGLALWLMRYDIARHTVKGHGLPRYTAVCLLSGYAWLVVGAAVGLGAGGMFQSSAYDTTVHALFLGFVFAMVFGHAPIIFPAVTRFDIPYGPRFYLPLLLLHLSLVLRLLGNALGDYPVRSAGGFANAVALLVFIATVVYSAIQGARTRAPQPTA